MIQPPSVESHNAQDMFVSPLIDKERQPPFAVTEQRGALQSFSCNSIWPWRWKNHATSRWYSMFHLTCATRQRPRNIFMKASNLLTVDEKHLAFYKKKWSETKGTVSHKDWVMFSWNTRVEPQPQYFAFPSLVPATLRLVSHLWWDLHWGFPRGKFRSLIFGEALNNIIEANDLSKHFSELTFGLVSWTFLGNIPKPLRCIILVLTHTHTLHPHKHTRTYIQLHTYKYQ